MSEHYIYQNARWKDKNYVPRVSKTFHIFSEEKVSKSLHVAGTKYVNNVLHLTVSCLIWACYQTFHIQLRVERKHMPLLN